MSTFIKIDKMKNSTIVINHPTDSSFGCSKKCTYCNWKVSPYLPSGKYDWDAMSDFINNAETNFITISGGGDPLYQVLTNEKYMSNLTTIMTMINLAGKHIRIITREIEVASTIELLIDWEIHWSFSLDAGTFKKLKDFKGNFEHVQASLVMPEDSMKGIQDNFLPWVLQVQNTLKCEIVLRENLNSFWEIDWNNVQSKQGIKYVSRDLCLDGLYFIDDHVKTGREITVDRRDIIHRFMMKNFAIIFGSFQRHIMVADIFDTYGDIDVVTDTDEPENFLIKEGFVCAGYQRVNENHCTALMQHSKDKDFVFHIQKVTDPGKYLEGMQLDIDQCYFDYNGNWHGPFSAAEYKMRVTHKQAIQTQKRNINPGIEHRYFEKLRRKGWKLELI